MLSPSTAANVSALRHLADNPVSAGLGSLVGSGVNAVFDAAGRWVADGAVWLLDGVGSLMSTTTTVDLGAGWFAAHEAVMATLAAAVILPLVCCAAIQAVYRQSASMLLRAVLVHLPLALLFSGVAVELVRLGLAVTDVLSARVLAGAGVDTSNVLQPIAGTLAASGIAAPGAPSFIVFVAGLLVAFTALVLWIELVVRAAAVTAAALFLPLALAGLVFPAVSHWCRRLADTLVALVLSKLVVAAVLSLAAGAIAGGLGAGAPGSGGFASIVTGVALLAMAAFSPFTLLRLVPAIEAGAISHLSSARHQAAAGARVPLQATRFAVDVASRVTPEGAALAGAAELAGVGTAGLGGAGDHVGSGLAAGGPAAGDSRSAGGSTHDPAGIPLLEGEPGGWEDIARVLQHRSAEPTPEAPAGDTSGVRGGA
ncbi:MAG TPA: hypothetical protein VMU09_12300 [Acidimicrobiales bacterium]|nr:hypothetical protein [Acidimicrobiales bacterium]